MGRDCQNREIFVQFSSPPHPTRAENRLVDIESTFSFFPSFFWLSSFFFFFPFQWSLIFFATRREYVGVAVGGGCIVNVDIPFCPRGRPFPLATQNAQQHTALFFFLFTPPFFSLSLMYSFDFTFHPLMAVRYQGYRSMTHS